MKMEKYSEGKKVEGPNYAFFNEIVKKGPIWKHLSGTNNKHGDYLCGSWDRERIE